MSKIKKIIFYILMWIIIFAVLLGLAIKSPQGIILDLAGYEIRTSIYFLSILFFGITLILVHSWRFIRAIKNGIVFLYGWITGRSRERAEKALLMASLYRIMGKDIQASKMLRQAERYFKNHPETAFVRLSLFEPSHILYDKNKETLRDSVTATPFYDYILWKEQEDKTSVAAMDFLEKTGLYRENKDDFLTMVDLYLRHNRSKSDFDKLFRIGRNLLGEVEYKEHDVYSHLIYAKRMLNDKNPALALKFAEHSLRFMPDLGLAFAMVVVTSKACLKENKASRLLSERFANKPDFLAVKLFLDMRVDEKPEALAKRIADIPRQKAQEEAFLALQAYQFALAKDIFSLRSVLKQAEIYHKSLWMVGVRLLIDSANRDDIYQIALTSFRGILEKTAYEQIIREREGSSTIYHYYLPMLDEVLGFKSIGQYELVCDILNKLLHPSSISQIGKGNATIDAIRLFEGDFSANEDVVKP